MFSAMLVWSALVALVPDFRDKLGTTFFDNWPRSAESALFIGFDKAGKNQAERAGFEPAVRCYSYADLANRCFRPLSHLSVYLNLLKSIQLRKKTKASIFFRSNWINDSYDTLGFSPNKR